jgi:hypothetical protein
MMVRQVNRSIYLTVFFILYVPTASYSQQARQLISSSEADTWVATDAIGRRLVTSAQNGVIREGRYVGIFYFIWQGAHGYDRHNAGIRADEGVVEKTEADYVSPYDISKMLAANPQNPQYGPLHAFHYWAEPYFGYYLPDDEWIIRKHAQILSDAGVDVIIIDVTNAAIYLPQVRKIAETYSGMRKEGLSTPSLAFIVNSNPVKTVERLYDNVYAKGLFKDLWFHWKGKPLLLAPPEDQRDDIKKFFTIRRSWAWSKGQEWFGDGKDKWTWLDHTPQSYGWHESPDKPEQISVSIAEHPVSNIGRSFHDGEEPEVKRSGEGLYFVEQWKRAKEVDPEFVFVTGWNEWVAMRFNDGKAKSFLGKPIEKGESYFVDLYNEEYSRDAEPMKDGFNDNYYYQLVNHIREFKGSRAVPVAKTLQRISIDGEFADWKNVEFVYRDDQGDTFHRKHPGWGRIQEYTNSSGRNDIIEARVSSDHNYVSFYVKTAQPITAWNLANWMHLFISIKNTELPNWEGYHFLVNRKPLNSTTTTLERNKGGREWEKVGNLRYSFKKNELELRIPKKLLGITGNSLTIDFKWADNAPVDGNAMHWLIKVTLHPMQDLLTGIVFILINNFNVQAYLFWFASQIIGIGSIIHCLKL